MWWYILIEWYDIFDVQDGYEACNSGTIYNAINYTYYDDASNENQI